MNSIKTLKHIATLALAIIFLANCSSEDTLTSDWIESNTTESNLTLGTLDASNFVWLGASISAGYQDGGFFKEGQENAYPTIVARQLQQADPTITYNYPNIVTPPGTGRTRIDLNAALVFLTTGQGSLGDALIRGSSDPFVAGGIKQNTNSPIHNYSVPGIRTIDMGVAGYGQANPFFGAFMSGPTATVLGDAVASSPSFFSLWPGGNDLLGYALGGGSVDGYDPTNTGALTDPATFSAALNGALSALTANGSHGIVLNVAPWTIIPFFQAATQLSGGVNLLPAGSIDVSTAAFLNSVAAYGAYNAALDQVVLAGAITAEEAAMRKITFTADVANSPVITDESLTDLSAMGIASMRQASPGVASQGIPADIFPLTAIFAIGVPQEDGSVPGVSVPLADQYTLTAAEQGNILAHAAQYNAAITAAVNSNDNLHMMDIQPMMADLFGLSPQIAAAIGMGNAGVQAADGVLGFMSGGINLVPLSLTQAELYNSVFSTDFVHPNPRGQALIANEIIKVLNAKYGATIPVVDPLTFEPIYAPF
jgi:hypothetical protein